jgi:hypothetical protein
MKNDPTDPFKHQTLTTTLVDAIPDAIASMPRDTTVPLWLALSMTAGFAGLLVSWWWLAGIGGVLSLCCIALWFWPAQVATERSGR